MKQKHKKVYKAGEHSIVKRGHFLVSLRSSINIGRNRISYIAAKLSPNEPS